MITSGTAHRWLTPFLICSLLSLSVARLITAEAALQAGIMVSVLTSSRQAVLRYTAPSEAPCTWEVSESSTYSPPVKDVDSALFSGANSDSRSGSLVAGTTRAFIVGTIQEPNGLLAATGVGGNKYGRALRPNTTHYARVTCGSQTGTASWTTKNIPLGKTWSEPVPMTAAGEYGFPTIDWASRAEVINDPQTGLRMRKISVVPDNNNGGDYMAFLDTGSQWACAQSTVNDSTGHAGYPCVFPMINGDARLYWINTATGDARLLGTMFMPGGQLAGFGSTMYYSATSSKFGADPTKAYQIFLDSSNNAHVVLCQLPQSGDTRYDTSVAPGVRAECDWSDLNSGTTLTAMLTAFDPNFEPAKFLSFTYQHVQGNYLFFTALRGIQNSYGWLGAYNLTNRTVTGFFPLYKHGAGSNFQNNFRWCGIHTPHQALGTNLFSWTTHTLQENGVGLGPYQVRLVGAMTNSQPTLVVNSNSPTNNTPSIPTDDRTLYDVAVGDQFWVDIDTGSQELMQITNINGNTWTVTRALAGSVANVHNNNATVTMACAAHSPNDFGASLINWWNPVADPHGTDTSGVNLVQINDGVTGHEGWANGFKIGEGSWQAAIGSAGVSLASFSISNSPTFAGAAKNASGNAWQPHPSPPQQTNASAAQGTDWALDASFIDSDSEARPTSVTNITGTLFKFANTNYSLSRKKLPMMAFCGSHPLLDISSAATGNQIGGAATDNYKYCVANAANECRAGSVVGDIYFNCPGANSQSTCPSGTITATSNESAVCISHLPGQGGQALEQIEIVGGNNTGKYLRTLTQMFMGYKMVDGLLNAHATPDGKWAMFPVDHDGVRDAVMIEVPAWAAYDNINRNDFQTTAVTAPALSGATEAFVEFGYDPAFNCTSRNEACVAASPSNDPYSFSSEPFNAVACASGCTINVPALPDHVIYYRVKWRDGGHHVVATSRTVAMVDGESSAAPSPNPSPTTVTLSGHSFYAAGGTFNNIFIEVLDANRTHITELQEQDASYSFTLPANATYIVRFRKELNPDYNANPKEYVITNAARDFTNLDFTIGPASWYAEGPVVTLDGGGAAPTRTLSGKTFYSGDNSPISFVTVQLFDGNNHLVSEQQEQGSTYSFVVQSGLTYVIRVNQSGWATNPGEIDVLSVNADHTDLDFGLCNSAYCSPGPTRTVNPN